MKTRFAVEFTSTDTVIVRPHAAHEKKKSHSQSVRHSPNWVEVANAIGTHRDRAHGRADATQTNEKTKKKKNGTKYV